MENVEWCSKSYKLGSHILFFNQKDNRLLGFGKQNKTWIARLKLEICIKSWTHSEVSYYREDYYEYKKVLKILFSIKRSVFLERHSTTDDEIIMEL